MSAAKAVMEARAAGIQLRVEGADLLMKAVAPPSQAVLELLSRHEPAILSWLHIGGDGWSGEDWRALFDERAGIAEFDGGLPRDQAEARAFACCVAEWLNHHAVLSPPCRCLGCGESEHGQDLLNPSGTKLSGHARLHSRCWATWHASRKAEAVAALSTFGIPDMRPWL